MKVHKGTLLLTILLAVTFGLACGCGRPAPQTVAPVGMTAGSPAGAAGEPLIPLQTQEEPDPDRPWVPEIVDRDDGFSFPPEPDDTRYAYETIELATVSGSFTERADENGGTDRVTAASSSMAVCRDDKTPFPYGTISCDVTTVSGTDSGIVFGLHSDRPSYWEGAGIGYYFFFLSRDGTAYLGKTLDGKWSALQTVGYPFTPGQTYTLKAVIKSGKICGYVNGELVIAYRDPAPLAGTAFGIRSGASGVRFSRLQVTNDYLYL